MKVLTRFTVYRFVSLALLTLLVFMAIMVGGVVYDLADILFSGRAKIGEAALLLAYKLPALLTEALPLAVVLAMWLFLDRFRRDNGLVVLKAAGTSYGRFILPLIGSAVVVSFLALLLQESWVPAANHRAEKMISSIVWRQSAPLVRERVFFKDNRGRFFYIRQVEENELTWQGLTVYDASDPQAPVLLVARNGRVSSNREWILENGILYRMDKDGFVEQEVNFATFRLPMDQQIDTFLGEQKTTLEMTRKELAETIALFQNGGVDVTPLVMDYHLKMAAPWANLVFALLALGVSGFLVTERQGNRFLGLGVVSALVFLYYVASAITRSLGAHEGLNPVVAAWVPPVIFGLVGLVGILYEPPGRGWGKTGLVLSLVVLLEMGMGGTTAMAAEPEQDMLRIQALQVVYRPDEILEAKGQVILTYGKIRLEAEEIRLDTGEDTLYVPGRVRITQGEDSLEGQELVYRLKDKSWTLGFPAVRVEGSQLAKDAFLRGEEVVQPPGTDQFVFSRGTATTCDRSEPHYQIKGERVEYYPGDKIVIRPATYYEGKIPVFTLPMLVMYLGEEDRRFYPTVGYTEEDGFFILTAYHFLVQPRVTGILLADYYQKKGLGLGTEWRFRPEEDQQGTVLLYGKEEDQGQGDYRLQGTWQDGPPQDQLNVDGYFLTQNQLERTEEKLTLRHHSSGSDALVGWRSVGWGDYGEDLLVEGSYAVALSPEWRVRTSGSYFRPYYAVEGGVNGAGELSYDGKDVRAKAGATSDLFQKKIMASVGTKTMPWVNYELSGEKTFTEWVPNGTYRSQLTARTYEYRVPLGSLAEGFNYYTLAVTDYNGEAAQERLTGTMGVRVGVPANRLTLSYSPMRTWGGPTPELYRETVGDRLDAGYNVYGLGVNLTAKTGYNIPLGRYDDLLVTLGGGNGTQASLDYDLNKGELETFAGSVRVNLTPAAAVGVSGRYNAQQLSLEELKTTASLKVRPGVILEYERTTWSLYRRTTSAWRLKGDLHCRRLDVTWRPEEGVFYLELLFLAFPQDPVRLGNDLRFVL